MANVSTYRQLSEIIQNQHYNGYAPPNADISQPHIAQLIATKIAKYATISAFKNGNAGDTAYADDQFVSVYNGLALQTNTNGEKYVVLPATPAGLPKNTEIVQVSFTPSYNMHVIPLQQKDDFVESLLPPLPQKMIMYKIENGNIVFRLLPAIINATVNVKMIGVISGTNIMNATLNIPKDLEDIIRTEILEELQIHYKVKSPKIEAEGEQ